jgi:hypothetical protein
MFVKRGGGAETERWAGHCGREMWGAPSVSSVGVDIGRLIIICSHCYVTVKT